MIYPRPFDEYLSYLRLITPLLQTGCMTRIFIDSDACPVKDEVYRVAARYKLHVFVVANRMISIPDTPLVERVVVEHGPDVADDWIAEHAQEKDIIITSDIPLAARCVEKGAYVLEPKGRLLDESTIGMALAMRNLMTDLRSAGVITPGGSSFGKTDRSRFLSELDTLAVKAQKPKPRSLIPPRQ